MHRKRVVQDLELVTQKPQVQNVLNLVLAEATEPCIVPRHTNAVTNAPGLKAILILDIVI